MFSFRKRKNSTGGGKSPEKSRAAAGTAYSPQEEDLPYTAPDGLYTDGSSQLVFSVAPSGTMKIRLIASMHVPGFSPLPTCIQLEYHIPSDTQKSYHPHPGQAFSGTHRYAYLPNNDEGCQLLIRFKVAWKYGYMFKIGKSLTSGLDNQVTWSTIPNKTSLQGGPFGFPDAAYIGKANAELDKLGIPSADQSLVLLSKPPESAPPPTGAGPPPAMNPSFHPAAAAAPMSALPPAVPVVVATATSSTASFAPAAASSSAPYAATSFPAASAPLAPATFSYASAPALDEEVRKETIHYNAPETLAPSITSGLFVEITGNDDCPICLEKVCMKKSVQIKQCKHEFHFSCLEESLSHNPRCPSCREPLEGAQGKSPSGTMKIDKLAKACPGFAPGTLSICITYTIPSGVQKHYHENPNQPFDGTTRIAYLPNNVEGRKVLWRLKYAWTHGLIFRIGTSLTTGIPNQVTWTSIHHKTSLHGGVHGFPDPKYMDNVNGSLDALHVPKA